MRRISAARSLAAPPSTRPASGNPVWAIVPSSQPRSDAIRVGRGTRWTSSNSPAIASRAASSSPAVTGATRIRRWSRRNRRNTWRAISSFPWLSEIGGARSITRTFSGMRGPARRWRPPSARSAASSGWRTRLMSIARSQYSQTAVARSSPPNAARSGGSAAPIESVAIVSAASEPRTTRSSSAHGAPFRSSTISAPRSRRSTRRRVVRARWRRSWRIGSPGSALSQSTSPLTRPVAGSIRTLAGHRSPWIQPSPIDRPTSAADRSAASASSEAPAEPAGPRTSPTSGAIARNRPVTQRPISGAPTTRVSGARPDTSRAAEARPAQQRPAGCRVGQGGGADDPGQGRLGQPRGCAIVGPGDDRGDPETRLLQRTRLAGRARRPERIERRGSPDEARPRARLVGDPEDGVGFAAGPAEQEQRRVTGSSVEDRPACGVGPRGGDRGDDPADETSIRRESAAGATCAPGADQPPDRTGASGRGVGCVDQRGNTRASRSGLAHRQRLQGAEGAGHGTPTHREPAAPLPQSGRSPYSLAGSSRRGSSRARPSDRRRPRFAGPVGCPRSIS